jgi:type I restriction enzyme R subunit
VRYADYVVSGQGADDTVDGMTKIRRFKKEAFPQILVSVNMLDTGFDCPEVVSLVFARFTAPPSCTSRCAAAAPARRNKPVFTMFDFVGVTDYHGDDDDYAGEGGIVIAKPSRRKNTSRAGCWRWMSTTTSTPHARVGHGRRRRQHGVPRGLGAACRRTGRPLRGLDTGAKTGLMRARNRWLRMIGSQLRANADTTGTSSPRGALRLSTPSRCWAACPRRCASSAVRSGCAP